MEAAAGQLEVVGADDEGARGDEDEEPEVVDHRTCDPDPHGAEGSPVAVLDPDGHLLAVYRRQGAGFRPAVVLA